MTDTERMALFLERRYLEKSGLSPRALCRTCGCSQKYPIWYF